MSDGFKPTDEQLAALDAYRTGDDLVIEAAAGSGKTSTLIMLAEAMPRRTGQYTAFNKGICTEVETVMPSNVRVNTAHSLAFRAVGHRFKHRLNGPRMRSFEIAQRLRMQPLAVAVEDRQKVLGSPFLASLTMKALTAFCQSADAEPNVKHVPYVAGIDMPDGNGRLTFANNNRLSKWLLPYVERAWQDAQDVHGHLPFKHEAYLKIFERSNPYLPVDVVFIDEAQDLSPVLLSIVEQQRHAQRVVVGDDNQTIYGFLGCENALQSPTFAGARRAMLSQSFRFGQTIADVANQVLDLLPTDMVIRGTPAVGSVVGPVADPDCVLTRTNATAVATLLRALEAGRKPHLVGGGEQVVAFCRGASDLQQNGTTQHPELACFDSWSEVVEYCQSDPSGDELALLVKLITEFGAQQIVAALDRMPRVQDADLVISTAHRSKGLAWPTVQLAGDFPGDLAKASDDELRLLYVAVTRARRELDVESVPGLEGPAAPAVDSLAGAQAGAPQGQGAEVLEA